MSSTDLLTDEEGKLIYSSDELSVNLYQVNIFVLLNYKKEFCFQKLTLKPCPAARLPPPPPRLPLHGLADGPHQLLPHQLRQPLL